VTISTKKKKVRKRQKCGQEKSVEWGKLAEVEKVYNFESPEANKSAIDTGANLRTVPRRTQKTPRGTKDY